MNEKKIIMREVHKISKKLKKKDSSLSYSLCLSMAFKMINRKKVIRKHKIIDIIMNKGLLTLLGI